MTVTCVGPVTSNPALNVALRANPENCRSPPSAFSAALCAASFAANPPAIVILRRVAGDNARSSFAPASAKLRDVPTQVLARVGRVTHGNVTESVDSSFATPPRAACVTIAAPDHRGFEVDTDPDSIDPS